MRSIVVDGQDVEAVHAAATEAVAHARAGNGPVFLLANTYRLTGHYVGDPQVYRPKGEQRDLRATQDPIPRLRELLGVGEDSWSALETKVAATVEASVEFAKNGTDRLPEDALLNVYA
jgi:pyruvate dehydrogenase E1 component alpha subunit